MAKKDYGADSLTVLEGLDAVRKRPGMYIGTTDSQGLMHCLWEIIDNAVDEALAGACTHITVTLHKDGSIEVADNGRGIPVDVEPKTKLTGVEVVLTKLHAGAKFGNASYNAAGGLHGVGSSVVNALSSRLDVEVDRNGHTYHMAFHQGHPGVYTDVDPLHPSPDAPFKKTRKNRPTELEVIGKVPAKTTGTRIRYWADPEIFNASAKFDYDQLIDRVRQTSFLVPGLTITVVDEHIDETGDAAVDELVETDAAQAQADQGEAIDDGQRAHDESQEQLDFASNDADSTRSAPKRAPWWSWSRWPPQWTRVRPHRGTGASRNSATPAASSTSSISSRMANLCRPSGASPGKAPTMRRRRSWTTPATCTPRRSRAHATWISPCGGSTATTRRCAVS